MAFKLIGDKRYSLKGDAEIGDVVVLLWKNYVRRAKTGESKPIGIVMNFVEKKPFVHWVQPNELYEVEVEVIERSSPLNSPMVK